MRRRGRRRGRGAGDDALAGADLTYSWTVADANRTALAGVSSTSVDPRFLKLPARALDAGRAYFATARVVDRRTGRNNSLEVRLDVQSSPLVARLAGG